MPQREDSRRKRCKRFNDAGHAHFLTFSCFRQQSFFTGQLAPKWFLESLDTARKTEGFDLWAYVIMPEHVHLLIWPHGEYSISRILSRIKSPLTHRVLRHVKTNSPDFLKRMEQRTSGGRVVHRFWQPGGGYDRNLWSAEQIHEKIAYIHDNPVRRGLVSCPEDWPWSSYHAWATGSDEPLSVDRDSAPVLES